MRDRNSGRNKGRVPVLAQKAIFLSLALIVGLVERAIPFDFIVPGVKLGLANAVILAALYVFPWHAALQISLLKCIVIALLSGSAVSFLYSCGGAVLSYAVMLLLIRVFGTKIGPVGVSVCGAVLHNIGQILVASLIMRTFMIVTYLPVLLVSGVITGVIVGVIVSLVLKRIGNSY